jgi:hypothetical protein
LPQKLLLKPGNVSFRKASGFRDRARARNGHPRRPVGTQAQDIAPRPPVADEAQPYPPCAGDQPVVVRLGGPSGAKEPFELHAGIKGAGTGFGNNWK